MASFTFEYSRRGDAPLIAERIDVPNGAAIWCYVEVLALRVGESPGAFIRVTNEGGQAVVRTGVATALASIEQCPCGSCAVKEAARGGRIFNGDFQLSPCRSLGSCTCKSFTQTANVA
ncbi:hypothetical protein [Methylocystis parvus]|uniref:Uncharacterized protein n=1 Tax=Methylocystis parvus TaxID=134 RepID=A0A6B8M3I5_9HYPH|nr:hypothetical protein [Methylocystis parvus]QGM96926.1 hypothetical protein F7D14_05180 [Methylocystis parvus]WBJ99187.1 hypothetical protein MMG94_14435 [Methylocystis parvus OBBP]